MDILLYDDTYQTPQPIASVVPSDTKNLKFYYHVQFMKIYFSDIENKFFQFGLMPNDLILLEFAVIITEKPI